MNPRQGDGKACPCLTRMTRNRPARCAATCNCCGCRTSSPPWPTWPWASCSSSRPGLGRSRGRRRELTRRGWWLLGLLVASSSLLYAAGVVLNDVFDLERDRQERPDRPAALGPRFARGSPAGWAANASVRHVPALRRGLDLRQPRLAVVAVALALAIVLYDRLLKRTLAGAAGHGRLPHAQRAAWA